MNHKITCFLSYCHAQKSLADQFVRELDRQPDFAVWIDRERLLPSQRLYNRLEQAVRAESDCAICLYSREYKSSSNCMAEFNAAVERWVRDGKPLLIAKVDDTPLPIQASDILYVPLTEIVNERDEIDIGRLSKEIEDLCNKIRSLLHPSPDIVAFFDPGERASVSIVSNRAYTSPYCSMKTEKTENLSTTDRFIDAVLPVLGL